MEKYLLLLIMALIGTFGQIVLKTEVNQLLPLLPKIDSLGSFLSVIFILLKNLKILSVIFFYGLSFFIWFFVLTKFELSYALPIVAAVIYILVLFFSWLFLKESLTTLRILGTLTIIIGIILINIKKG